MKGGSEFLSGSSLLVVDKFTIYFSSPCFDSGDSPGQAEKEAHKNDQSGILELYMKLHGNEAQRGRQFEHICKWFLQNDPEYRRQLRR